MTPILRLRACVIVMLDARLLLVPHFHSDLTYWHLPGGAIEFGERLRTTAERECFEETGIVARCTDLFDIAEVIEANYHSVTHVYQGVYASGAIIPEKHAVYGDKTAKWWDFEEVRSLNYRPVSSITKLLEHE